MDIYLYFVFIIGGIIAALPVIVCKIYYGFHPFYFSLSFVLWIILLWTFVTFLYLYCILQKIKMGVFYSIIKLVEIFVPILVSVFFYKDKYSYYNYFGFLLAMLAIYFISI